jgi:hypothetical protein
MSVDRKSLLREFKERVVPMGVYRVRNTITGNAFLAASKDTTAILNRHVSQLRLNGHPNKVLQADWQAHGEASFVFEVLDTLAPSGDPAYDPTDDLGTLEDMWLEKLGLAPDPWHTFNPRRLRR